jgi:hypothetical protein
MRTGNNSSNSADYYLERATECERLARDAMIQENRRILLELAARWRALAANERGSPPDE